MATTRTRRNIDELIAAQEAKLKALKAAKRNAGKKSKDITKDSEGMANLIAALDAAAAANKVKKPALIKVLARVTRSGLKFVE